MITRPYRLISIGPSHFCEKARWALQRLGVPFIEEAHFPAFHFAASFGNGGGRTVPVLVAGNQVLGDSTDILKYLDSRHGPGNLYPLEPALRSEVETLEDLFDEKLGPHPRRLVYYHLFPYGRLLREVMSGPGVRPLEATLFGLSFPLVRTLLRKAMRIDAAGAERSRQSIRRILELVQDRLADGRHYLVGDRFTAADLTFASLAGILVWSEQYGWSLPAVERMPEELLKEIEQYRNTPAGRYVQRIYREERHRTVQPGEV